MKNYSHVRFLSLTLLILSLVSCAFFSEYAKLERSARDAYSRADYDTAVFMLAKSLQINQSYAKSQTLAADAFLMANKLHLERIKELQNNSDPFKHDQIAHEYQSLVNLANAVKDLPPIRHPKTGMELVFKVTDYSDQLQQSKRLAAQAHYDAGDTLAQSTVRADQKAAAKQFKQALKQVPDFKDAAQRYASSRKAGIKRMAVFPFEDLSGKRKRYGAVEELVVDQMVTSVMKDPAATEFLELISREQLDRVINEQKLGLSGMVNEESAMEVGAILGVHEIITGKITQIIYSPVQTVHRDYTETNKIVVKREKYKDQAGKTKTRKVYADVTARVRHYTRTTKAVIKGSYRIIDVRTAKLIKSEAFEGKSDFKAEWVTFKGDERALSYKTSKLARGGEIIAPVAEEMVSRAATDLANSLSVSLKLYAR